MKEFIRLSFILLTIVPAIAWSCDDLPHPTFFTTGPDGDRFGLFIPSDQIENTERWLPEQGSPPLSIPSAHKLAMEWFLEQHPEYTEVDAVSIRLNRYRCSTIDDRWYYLLELYPTIQGNYRYSGEDWVAVLMDGTVVGMRKY